MDPKSTLPPTPPRFRWPTVHDRRHRRRRSFPPRPKPGDKPGQSCRSSTSRPIPSTPSCWASGETGVENGMGVHRFFYNGGATSTCPPTAWATPATSTASWTSSAPPTRWRWARQWVPCQFTDGLKGGRVPGGRPPSTGSSWTGPQLHGPPFVVATWLSVLLL